MIHYDSPPRVTTNHPASRHGVPVFLDAYGSVLDIRDGVQAALSALGWSRVRYARVAGITLSNLNQALLDTPRHRLSAAALNVLAEALERPGAAMTWPLRVKRWRTGHGWTIEEAARFLGVSRQTLSAWERGAWVPLGKPLDRVFALMNAHPVLNRSCVLT